MHAKLFVDSNIWIYAHIENQSDPRCDQSWDLINSLNRPVISPQVIAEYYNAMLRNQQEDAWIQDNIVDMLLHCELQPLGRAVVKQAMKIRARYGFSYWDCQIIAAALEAGCATLITEDLQARQIIDGVLTVVNPFHA